MVARHEIKDAKTLVGLSMLEERLERDTSLAPA